MRVCGVGVCTNGAEYIVAHLKSLMWRPTTAFLFLSKGQINLAPHQLTQELIPFPLSVDALECGVE